LRARAERDLRLLALDSDDDPFVVFYRGRAYNRLGRRAEAKQALERVANWKWVDERLQANALALLMRLAAAGTDRLATLQLVRDSTGRFPTDRMTLLTAADVCIQVDDLAQAIACMRQALNSPEYRGQGIGALDRPEPHVRLQLAQCLTCVHKFREAIEEYRRAVEGGIETVAAFCSWGITYELVHQPQDAEACFQKAIKVDAEVAEPHRRLGLLYAEHGREHEALGELGRALRLGDSTPEIKTTIERLTRQRAFHEQT
jgi:tetratricopeptide (TPR) repeat protein